MNIKHICFPIQYIIQSKHYTACNPFKIKYFIFAGCGDKFGPEWCKGLLQSGGTCDTHGIKDHCDKTCGVCKGQ